MQNPGYDGFIWFIGIVEDVKDPKKLGRVRVRMINEYNNRVSTDDIPWAIVLTPPNTASYKGVGVSPIGLIVGSRVVGFFLDGMHKSKPVVLGSMPIILNGDESDHSVSAQARGEGPVQKEYLDIEPKTQYAAEYPFNKTYTTISGHVIEVDDTPSKERIHIYHTSGSYIEIAPDGMIVTKSFSDMFNISGGDVQLYSAGDTSILSEGIISIAANEGVTIEADVPVEIIGSGGLYVNGPIKVGEDNGRQSGASGQFTSAEGRLITVVNGIIVSIV